MLTLNDLFCGELVSAVQIVGSVAEGLPAAVAEVVPIEIFPSVAAPFLFVAALWPVAAPGAFFQGPFVFQFAVAAFELVVLSFGFQLVVVAGPLVALWSPEVRLWWAVQTVIFHSPAEFAVEGPVSFAAVPFQFAVLSFLLVAFFEFLTVAAAQVLPIEISH